MSFEFERIIGSASVKETEEYKQAVHLGGGIPISSRVVDREIGASFYCLSVGGGPEDDWPGHYILFYENEVIHIKALLKEKWEEGIGNVARYRILELDYPRRLDGEKTKIIGLVQQALKAKSQSYPAPPSLVLVEIK